MGARVPATGTPSWEQARPGKGDRDSGCRGRADPAVWRWAPHDPGASGAGVVEVPLPGEVTWSSSAPPPQNP